ncbi:pheromone-binding protein Gp-9-like [Lasioglossum baleicum]|uniref:pheromone-binding protein Gp-9-like n=1 Tax=Lasioglossum baleicum TaxID=434251 RepID=UPI003FCE1EC6
MKYLLLFMFVAVALADQVSETTQERAARNLARVFRIDSKDILECVNKSQATMEDVLYMFVVMESGDTEVTNMTSLKKASCAMVCCAQKKGFMVGAVVQEEEMIKTYQKMGMPEDAERQVRNILRNCKEQVTDTSDECMAGYQFFKCSLKRFGM